MNKYLAGGALMSALVFSGTTGLNGKKDEAVKHQAHAAVSGTITVDVKGQRYWQYELRPFEGTVTRILERNVARNQNDAPASAYLKPAGAISSCADKPEAMSSDGTLVATCEQSKNSEVFVVRERSTRKELLRWIPAEYRGVRGFAWSPDSKSIVVLNESDHYGKTPLELLSGLAGHPVPHNTVFVELFVVEAWDRTEYVVRKDVPYAFSRILDWKQ